MAAVARIAVSSVLVRTPAGMQDMTVAGVDPVEFRPFSPVSTARDERVWRALMEGDMFIAHEEEPRLGIGLGRSVLVRRGEGQDFVRVGGLAANGSPNVAGALMSLAWGRRFGIDSPRILYVGVAQGASPEVVARTVQTRFPQLLVEGAPAPASGVAFLSGTGAARLFGRFRYVPRADGTLEPDPAWVRANISTRRVPILGSVTCHRLLFPQLQAALTDIARAGLSSLIDVADYRRSGGCYVPRFIGRDPNQPVSLHAWGLALDINVGGNRFGASPTQDARLVATFERWGFRWGGRWSPPDGMHFELAALLRR